LPPPTICWERASIVNPVDRLVEGWEMGGVLLAGFSINNLFQVSMSQAFRHSGGSRT
jgi:hypothetical protein